MSNHLRMRRPARAAMRRVAALVLLTTLGLPGQNATAAAAPPAATAEAGIKTPPADTGTGGSKPAAGAGQSAGGTGTGTPTSADAVPAPPTAEELAVAEAELRLSQLAAEASAALEAYQTAVRARDEALRLHLEEAERWKSAQAQLDASRGEMARWTSQAYRQGAAGAGVAGFVSVADARSPDDLQRRVAVLRQVGRAEARSLAGAAEAEAGQAAATAEAEDTARTALQAAADAQAAKAASDASVAQQREQLAQLEALLAQAEQAQAAVDAQDAAARDSAARDYAARRDAAQVMAADSGSRAALPGCLDDDLTGFANGQIPADHLCALPGKGGQALRSDAAAAFVELDAAYTLAHGQGLCITDSYRDYDSQVALRAAKPTLAAVPGTSNHGWGVALDLCGGAADFAAPEHTWMRLNAPLHGWFHPSWAAQDGSKPEPWHWEFAG